MGETIEIFYINENKESVKGVFSLKRLLTGESTMIYDLCRKKNQRTGQDLGYDESKYSKLRLAMMIEDCPIVLNGTQWKDLDTTKRAEALDTRLEEDMFLHLLNYIKSMNRLDTQTENLS